MLSVKHSNNDDAKNRHMLFKDIQASQFIYGLEMTRNV